MIEFERPKDQSSIIKVIGVGGGGGNAVNYMYGLNVEGVNFIVCNTDSQALERTDVPNKVQLGPNLTGGLGAGANPEIGKQAGEESIEEINELLDVNTKMAFITAGMGGGTGTGAAPVIAKACKERDILTVGIVTTPFAYEGRRRMTQAEAGIAAMKEHVDTILIISNDKLRQQYGNLPFSQAFSQADDVLSTAAKCITDLITENGQVNLDFNDVDTVMKQGGVAILGRADSAGEDRAKEAVQEALNSPLLNDSEIEGAKWILLNITSAEGDHEHTLDELETIQQYVQEQAGNGCDIILGMGNDPMLDDKLAVTIIATGFQSNEIEAKMPPITNKNKVVVNIDDEDAESRVEAKAEKEQKKEKENPMEPSLFDRTEKDNYLAENASDQQETNNISKGRSTVTLELPDYKDAETSDNDNEASPSYQDNQPADDNEDANDKQSEDKPLKQVGEVENDEAGNEGITLSIKSDEEKQQIEETNTSDSNQSPKMEEVHNRFDEFEKEQKEDLERRNKELEERAEKLRQMSFDFQKSSKDNNENNEDEEKIPAYIRQQKNLDDHKHSSDNSISDFSIEDNGKNGGRRTGIIRTINSFLSGDKPD